MISFRSGDRFAPTRRKRYKNLPYQVLAILIFYFVAFFYARPYFTISSNTYSDSNSVISSDVDTSNYNVLRVGRVLLSEGNIETVTAVDDHSGANNNISSGSNHNSSNDGGHGGSGAHQVFPNTPFTQQQLLDGLLVLYVVGDVYMFVCLALVCEEFFVPAVTIITEHFELSEDLAGATLLAFAGSGPEIFTSFIGVFISQTSIGIGTIIGSAVFNLTVVHGLCALVSPAAIQLGWWAVFRDSFFYSISLGLLIVFFADNKMLWWESLILVCFYVVYVTFMKYNQRIRVWLRGRLRPNSVEQSEGEGEELPEKVKVTSAASTDTEGAVVVTIDRPPTAGSVSKETYDKAHLARPVASAKRRPSMMMVVMQAELLATFGAKVQSVAPPPPPSSNSHVSHSQTNKDNTSKRNSKAVPGRLHQKPAWPKLKDNQLKSTALNGCITAKRKLLAAAVEIVERSRSQQQAAATSTEGAAASTETSPDTTDTHWEVDSVTSTDVPSQQTSEDDMNFTSSDKNDCANEEAGPIGEEKEGDGEEGGGGEETVTHPSLLVWPTTWRKRISFLLVAPALVPLCLTLPDVRHPTKRKFCVWTFAGSVLWIALFSYCLSWWATVIGNALYIPSAEMGLIFLAFGTSVPDLIASVIVVKRGFGDMAVTGSFGSNILDITVGLPLPWLLYSAAFGPYKVSNEGLLCSMIMMFLILLITVLMSGIGKWRLTRPMGIVMFGMYVTFVLFSALLQHGVFSCPQML